MAEGVERFSARVETMDGTPTAEHSWPEMEPHPRGAWVLFSDYEKEKARADELEARLAKRPEGIEFVYLVRCGECGFLGAADEGACARCGYDGVDPPSDGGDWVRVENVARIEAAGAKDERERLREAVAAEGERLVARAQTALETAWVSGTVRQLLAALTDNQEGRSGPTDGDNAA